MRSLTPVFEKVTTIDKASLCERDYVYYWQLWHHNWDDSDLSLVRELCSLHGSRVLEIGCGDGRMTIGLSGDCKSITGVDLDERLIELANNRLGAFDEGNIEFLKMDAEQLQLSDKSFDVVLFPWVLQMVRNPLRAVLEAHRVLKPGGSMVVIGLRSDADYDSIISRFADHNSEIDPRSQYELPITQVFGATGVTVKTEWRFDYFFENVEIAIECFIFALDRWYSTQLSLSEKEELRELLNGFVLDQRVRLQFPAEVYLVKKTN